jgi:hypothetical protein
MDNRAQPVKATEPGRGGRKHTLALVRLNDAGKPEIHLQCDKSGCGCSGWYALEDLISGFEHFVRDGEKEKKEEEIAA